MTQTPLATARIARIRNALAALSPVDLDIVDESARHAGHAGAQSGRGHFRIRLVSERFDGLKSIQRHRAVYDALGSLMETDIHALTLETLTSREAARAPTRTHSTA